MGRWGGGGGSDHKVLHFYLYIFGLNFECIFVVYSFFRKKFCFEKFFQESEFQRVWIQIRPDLLIWV